MRRSIAALFSVLVLVGILTGCGLKMESCTTNNKCMTSVPPLPKGPLATSPSPYDAVETALAKDGYTPSSPVGERTLTKWVKGDTTVTIDRNTDGSKTSINFPEGTVTCDDIGADAAGIDVIGFVAALHKLGHAKVLEQKKPLCHK